MCFHHSLSRCCLRYCVCWQGLDTSESLCCSFRHNQMSSHKIMSLQAWRIPEGLYGISLLNFISNLCLPLKYFKLWQLSSVASHTRLKPCSQCCWERRAEETSTEWKAERKGEGEEMSKEERSRSPRAALEGGKIWQHVKHKHKLSMHLTTEWINQLSVNPEKFRAWDWRTHSICLSPLNLL